MSVVALLSLNFVIPQRAELASTYIQTASDTKKSSEPSPTSVSATFGAGATAGNLIVAILGAGGNVTLNAPSGFSTAINQSGTPSQAIFYKTAAGGETAITATVSSNPSSIGLHIYEYSGGDNTLDLTSSSSGFGTSTVSGTITTTFNNAMIIAAFTDDINTNHNDGSWNDGTEGFTERNDFKTTGAGTSNTFAGGDNLTNSAGSQSVNTNIGGNANWRGQIVSFGLGGAIPTVSNVTSSTANGTYGVGAVISVQVVFSEVVNVTGTPQLTLETGGTDAVLNYTSGSGTNTLTFNYTVASGQTSADLDYTSTTALALNGGTIQDVDTNNATLTLATPGAAGSLGANKAIVIDGVAPTISQVTPVPSPTNDNTPNYTFNSTEAGTITYGGDCSSATTAASAGNNTITFNALANGVHSNCTITVTDAANNISNILNVNSFTVDTVAPTVTNVTSLTADGTYGAGANIDIRVTFSEVVNVTNNPTIILETGASDAVVSYTSGTGTNTLVFNYTVAIGHASLDLDYISTTALALSGGTIQDAATNNATLTLASPGAASSLGFNKNIVISVDITPPVIAEVTPVPTPTNDTTPNYTFSSTESGTITYGGDCSSVTTSAVAGNNTVTFSTLASGLHNNCTITVTDASSNVSNLLNVSPFTIDTIAPAIAEVTPVPTPANDTTPNYTFSSTEAGTITYGGDCSSATTAAIVGNNTVTFNALTQGLHNNCTITVTDSAGNVSNLLNISPFTIDTTMPVLNEITPVPTPTNDTTPNYTFSSSEAGTITYGGDCSSVTTAATAGNNTVTFNALAPGLHNNCTITVTDGASNVSNVLNVSPFTIDTTAPTVTEVTSVPDPTADNTPDYTFNTTEGGTIIYIGDCTSATTSAVSGNNTITFNALSSGLHNNCTLTVTDAAGNVSNVLNITPFTVNTSDITPPTIAEVIPVPDPTNDTTPNYTFSSTEAGTITYGGDCSSATTSAIVGNNTVTFNTLSNGLHNNCTVTVTDAASNVSNVLNVSPFTVDTGSVGDLAAPTLIEIIPVPTPDNDPTPEYTFNSTEGGVITYSGGCVSDTTIAVPGDNTIIFGPLEPGTYDNCTITVTDAFGNQSIPLQISPFTIEDDSHASARHRRRSRTQDSFVGCSRGPNSPVPFIDIFDANTFPHIENFYRRCIVDGRTSVLFMPDSSVTKAEYVKIVLNTFNLGTASYEPAFADVTPDNGLAPYIIQAAHLGFIYNYSPGGVSYFYPNAPITRAEAFKILALAKKASLGIYEAHFSDVHRDDWYYDYAAWAQNAGLAVGYHKFFGKDGTASDFYTFPALLYKPGDTGIDVLHYKEILAQLGYFFGEMNEFYDNELKSAVSAYQTVKGITPNTGQIGAQTRTSLLSETLVPRDENWFRGDKPITRGETTKIVHLSENL